MTTLNTIWQQFTLQNLLLYQWRNSSFLYQLTGFLHQWRQGSWLLQWGEPLGALLITIVFCLAPFVGTALIGVLLIACAGWWQLQGLTKEFAGNKKCSHCMDKIKQQATKFHN